MLQQTQVPRVIVKYREFLREFPTVDILARATLAQVLKLWSGLGYNRRGKYLHETARLVMGEYRGNLKKALMHPLPGVGPYTRAAVRTFAYKEPHTMLETNIRTAFIHHFYQGRPLVKDKDILTIATKAAEHQDPREWHWALMDYGAHIKKLHKNPARRSTAYVRQSKFEGSLRQARGAILRALHDSPESEANIRSDLKNLPRSDLGKFKTALAGLAKDGLVVKEKGKWRIA
ncbi:MAG TPA: A/G-specific adenine glycosylase [Candidatus Paceibacterota bacterium]